MSDISPDYYNVEELRKLVQNEQKYSKVLLHAFEAVNLGEYILDIDKFREDFPKRIKSRNFLLYLYNLYRNLNNITDMNRIREEIINLNLYPRFFFEFHEAKTLTGQLDIYNNYVKYNLLKNLKRKSVLKKLTISSYFVSSIHSKEHFKNAKFERKMMKYLLDISKSNKPSNVVFLDSVIRIVFSSTNDFVYGNWHNNEFQVILENYINTLYFKGTIYKIKGVMAERVSQSVMFAIQLLSTFENVDGSKYQNYHKDVVTSLPKIYSVDLSLDFTLSNNIDRVIDSIDKKKEDSLYDLLNFLVQIYSHGRFPELCSICIALYEKKDFSNRIQSIAKSFLNISRFMQGEIIDTTDITSDVFYFDGLLRLLVQFQNSELTFNDVLDILNSRPISSVNVYEFKKAIKIFSNEDSVWILVYLRSINTRRTEDILDILEMLFDLILKEEFNLDYDEFARIVSFVLENTDDQINDSIKLLKSYNSIFNILTGLFDSYSELTFEIAMRIDSQLNYERAYNTSDLNGMTYNLLMVSCKMEQFDLIPSIVNRIEKYSLSIYLYLVLATIDKCYITQMYQEIMKELISVKPGDIRLDDFITKQSIAIFYSQNMKKNIEPVNDYDKLYYDGKSLYYDVENSYLELHAKEFNLKEYNGLKNMISESFLNLVVSRMFLGNPTKFGLIPISGNPKTREEFINIIQEETGYNTRQKEYEKYKKNEYPILPLLQMHGLQMVFYDFLYSIINEKNIGLFNTLNIVRLTNNSISDEFRGHNRIVHISSVLLLSALDMLDVLDLPNVYLSQSTYNEIEELYSKRPVELALSEDYRSIDFYKYIDVLHNKLNDLDQNGVILHLNAENYFSKSYKEFEGINKYDRELFMILISKGNNINYIISDDKYYHRSEEISKSVVSTFSLIAEALIEKVVTLDEFLKTAEILINSKYIQDFPKNIYYLIKNSNIFTQDDLFKIYNILKKTIL